MEEYLCNDVLSAVSVLEHTLALGATPTSGVDLRMQVIEVTVLPGSIFLIQIGTPYVPPRKRENS